MIRFLSDLICLLILGIYYFSNIVFKLYAYISNYNTNSNMNVHLSDHKFDNMIINILCSYDK